MELNTIYNMDCLEGMKQIPDGSIDAIICDLPYGTTQLEWDVVIPLDKLWDQYMRIRKENAPVILFSSQPFTTDLIISNRKMFKYEIIWEKTQQTGFFNAKKMPLRVHENILVFYDHQPTYNPQMWVKQDAEKIGRIRKNSDYKKTNGGHVGKVAKDRAESWFYEEKGIRYPTDIIKFSNWNGAGFCHTPDRRVFHPTQKPVDLLRYLVKTYTNEGDTVLDNCMGSGTTAVACVKEKRNFIGFELNTEYYNKAVQRIKAEQRQLSLF